MSPSRQDPAFEALLDYLKRTRGFDFTGYKRATLFRRITKRMQELGIESFGAYTDHLEVHPDEFEALFNTILINVTSFFRDPEAWRFLESEIVPRILERKGRREPIRLWSAGCASGEEAYTLAMLFAEALGRDAFRERVKIYATDVDEHALDEARRALYEPKDLEPVPRELRERYFEPTNGGLAFRSELRRSVIFGRHDLVQDAPIGRVDLLVCRNVLMYLNAETQRRVLARLHFALAEEGFLFLGKAEMLLTHAELFEPMELSQRVFRRAAGVSARERLAVLAQAGDDVAGLRLAEQLDLRDAALDAAPDPQLVVDPERILVAANREARQRFALDPRDLGRPLQDLEISYRPAELRSLLDRAFEGGETARAGPVEWALRNGSREHFEVEVVPLGDGEGRSVGASVTFRDRTREQLLRSELERMQHDLEHSSEELQSTNEELETTNEELQSTNEELETTNEELQSSNEELETTNEELQSTNEELRTMNDELQRRTYDLDRANHYMQSVLAGLPYAVVVIDRDLRVQIWERKAEELWGLRADEVQGEALLDLDIGLPVERLGAPVASCLSGEDVPDLAVDAVTRRGRPVLCRVSFRPLAGPTRRVEGVVLLMLPEEAPARAASGRGS